MRSALRNLESERMTLRVDSDDSCMNHSAPIGKIGSSIRTVVIRMILISILIKQLFRLYKTRRDPRVKKGKQKVIIS